MVSTPAASPPQIKLSREQTFRLVLACALVVLAAARVIPDVAHAVRPMYTFGYSTNGDAIVTAVSPQKVEGWDDTLHVGDRVNIARLPRYALKPGLTGAQPFTWDDRQRWLPIQRHGVEMRIRLHGVAESPAVRALTVLRVLLFILTLGLGALLFILKPGTATAGFFAFCAAAEAPTNFADTMVPMPYRPWTIAIGDVIRGAAAPALFVFAYSMLDSSKSAALRRRVVTIIAGVVALVLGGLRAYGGWRVTFANLPGSPFINASRTATIAIFAATIVTFLIAFVRAAGEERRRIAISAAAFALAAGARALSVAYFPAYIPAWLNGVLLSMTVVPALVIWYGILRHRIFEIDWVVSRALVYVSLSLAVLATIGLIEEVGTYFFVQNTNLAYIVLNFATLAIALTSGKITELVESLLDRFVFRERREQRKALELIAGYILDAETAEDVYRALVEDCTHALGLTFGGLFFRRTDGGFELAVKHDWPPDCVVHLEPNDELTQTITRSRGVLTFEGKETSLIRELFPNERLTFAAPIFLERSVEQIVIYGHNISGLDLDPDEREQLARVVAHASIALNAIELGRLRAMVDRALTA